MAATDTSLRTLECISPELERNVLEVSTLLDDIVLVGSTIDHHAGSWLPDKVLLQLEQIDERIQALGKVSVVFSGRGFVPVTMPNGDTDTIFADVSHRSGHVSSVDIFDEDDFDYAESDDLDDYIDDDNEDGNLRETDPEVEELRGRMLTPEKGRKLYVEFVLHQSHGDFNVHGMCVRTDRVTTHAIMEASSLAVSLIRPELNKTPIDKDNLRDELLEQSQRVLSMVRDTSFRRSSKKRQQRRLSEAVTEANADCPVDDFYVVVEPEVIFVPSTTEDGLLYMEAEYIGESCGQFDGRAIQLQSLDLFSIDNGGRVCSDAEMFDRRSGLCLVVEVSEDVAEMLGIESTDVWVPIELPHNKYRDRYPGFDAEFSPIPY